MRIYTSKPKGILGTEHQEFIKPEEVELLDGRKLSDVLEEIRELKKEVAELKKLLAEILAVNLEVKNEKGN
jgi:hypothetical protein